MSSKKNKTENLSSSKKKIEKEGKRKLGKQNKEKYNNVTFNSDISKQTFNTVIESKLKENISVDLGSAVKKTKDGGECLFEINEKLVNKSGAVRIINKLPSLSDDNVSDSDLIILSETDSNSPERKSCFDHSVDSSSAITSSDLLNCKNKSPTKSNEILVKYNNQENSSDKKTSPSYNHMTPKLSTAVSSAIPIGSKLDVKENDKFTSYQSTFSPINMLGEIQINSRIYFSESEKTANVYTDSPVSKNICDVLPVNSKGINSIQNSNEYEDLPDCSKSCVSMLNNILNASMVSKDYIINNQLNIKSIIKPLEFSYDQSSNAFIFPIDIEVLKAANSYIKANPAFYELEKEVSYVTVDNTEWQSNDLKSNDSNSFIHDFNRNNMNEKDVNLQFNSEDIESDFSFTSCNTIDIQPEFFGIPDEECSEKISEKVSTDSNIYLQNIDLNLENSIYSVDLGTSVDETVAVGNQDQFLENLNLMNEVNFENISKVSPKVKKRKKKSSWYPRRKKLCQKRNEVPKSSDTMMEDVYCDTCDEDDIEETTMNSNKCLSSLDKNEKIQKNSELCEEISLCEVNFSDQTDEVESNIISQTKCRSVKESKGSQFNKRYKPTKVVNNQDNDLKLSNEEISHDTYSASMGESSTELSKCFSNLENLEEVESQDKASANCIHLIPLIPDTVSNGDGQRSVPKKRRKRSTWSTKKRCRKVSKLAKTLNTESNDFKVNSEEILCDTCDEEEIDESVNQVNCEELNRPEFLTSNFPSDYVENNRASCSSQHLVNSVDSTSCASNSRSDIKKRNLRGNSTTEKNQCKKLPEENQRSTSENKAAECLHTCDSSSSSADCEKQTSKKVRFQILNKNKENECEYLLNDECKVDVDQLDNANEELVYKSRNEGEQLEYKMCFVKLKRLEELDIPLNKYNVDDLIAKKVDVPLQISHSNSASVIEHFDKDESGDKDISLSVSQSPLVSSSLHPEVTLPPSKTVKKGLKHNSKNKIYKHSSNLQICTSKINESWPLLSPKKTSQNISSPSKTSNIIKNKSSDSKNSNLKAFDNKSIKIYPSKETNDSFLVYSSETVTSAKGESNDDANLKIQQTECARIKNQISKPLKAKSKICSISNEFNQAHNVEAMNSSSTDYCVGVSTVSNISTEKQERNLKSQNKKSNCITKSKEISFDLHPTSKVSIPLKYINFKSSRTHNSNKLKNSLLNSERNVNEEMNLMDSNAENFVSSEKVSHTRKDKIVPSSPVKSPGRKEKNADLYSAIIKSPIRKEKSILQSCLPLQNKKDIFPLVSSVTNNNTINVVSKDITDMVNKTTISVLNESDSQDSQKVTPEVISPLKSPVRQVNNSPKSKSIEVENNIISLTSHSNNGSNTNVTCILSDINSQNSENSDFSTFLSPKSSNEEKSFSPPKSPNQQSPKAKRSSSSSACNSNAYCKSIIFNDCAIRSSETLNPEVCSPINSMKNLKSILTSKLSEGDISKITTLSASTPCVLEESSSHELEKAHSEIFSPSSPVKKLKNVSPKCDNPEIPAIQVSSVNEQNSNPCKNTNSRTNKSKWKMRINLSKNKSLKTSVKTDNGSKFPSTDSCQGVQTEDSSVDISDKSTHHVNNVKKKLHFSPAKKDSVLVSKSKNGNDSQNFESKSPRTDSETSDLDLAQIQTVCLAEEKISKDIESSENKKSVKRMSKSAIASSKVSEIKTIQKGAKIQRNKSHVQNSKSLSKNIVNKKSNNSKETDINKAVPNVTFSNNKNNSESGSFKNCFEVSSKQSVRNEQCATIPNNKLLPVVDGKIANIRDIVRNMKPIPKLSSKKSIETCVSQEVQANQSNGIANSQSDKPDSSKKDSYEKSGRISSDSASSDAVLFCTEAILLDEDLDFEPDQIEDISVENPSSDSVSAVSDVFKESCLEPVSAVNSSLNQQFTSVDEEEPTPNIDLDKKKADADRSELYLTLCSESIDYVSDSHLSAEEEITNPPHLSFLNNFRVVSQKRDLPSEDESDSDQEHSFKRSRPGKINNIEESSVESYNSNEDVSSIQRNVTENQHFMKYDTSVQNSSNDNNCSRTSNFSNVPASQNKLFHSPVDSSGVSSLNLEVSTGHIPHLDDLITKIKGFCDIGSVNQAVETAQTYIRITGSPEINKFIIARLFKNLIAFFQKANNENGGICDINIFDEALQLINDYKIYDKHFLSYIIISCWSSVELNIYSIKILNRCQMEQIPLNIEAINTFDSFLKSEEITLTVLLDFIEFVKLVCNRKISKELMHLALEKCYKMYDFKEADRICKLLHNITLKEIDLPNLQEFLQFCLRKVMWQHIADMFIEWDPKKSLCDCIYKALIAEYEAVGKNFRKIADSIYDSESPPKSISSHHKHLFGQIGTALMIGAFYRSNYPCAIEVLHTLHRYNVNYFELQLSSCSSFMTDLYTDKDLLTFPFFVVFTAIDICLHFNRPKDAFTVFQGFAWMNPDEKLNIEVKKYVVNERFQRLLKLVVLLNKENTLNEGWEALKRLLLIVEQDFLVEDLKKDAKHLKDLQSIYNGYLINFLNSSKVSSVQDLYQHSLGSCKEIFTISDDVLRGLTVVFSKNGLSQEANSLFMLGFIRKVYCVEKPQPESFPWNLIIMTHWTVHEIKLAIEWFLDYLFPILTEKPKKTDFEKWFSVKISFKVTHVCLSKIKCLKESEISEEECIKKSLCALESLDPNLQIIQKPGENNLYLNPDSVYNFWKSRCPNASPKVGCFPKDFLVSCRKRIAFGRESDTSSERELFSSVDQVDSKLKISQEAIMQSPNSESAESIVCGMIGEIRASTSKSSAIAAEVSTPKKSPPSRNYQHLSAIPSSFKLPLPVSPRSDIQLLSSEQMTVTQNAIEFPSGSKFIQTSIPYRLTDVVEKDKIESSSEYMSFKNISPGQTFHGNLSSVLQPSPGSVIKSHSCQNIRLSSTPPSSSNQSPDFKVNHSMIQSSPVEKHASQQSGSPYSSKSNSFQQEKISENLISDTDTKKIENVFSSFDSLSKLTAENISPKESNKINTNNMVLKLQNNIKKNSGKLLSKKRLKKLRNFASRAKSSSLTPESLHASPELSKVHKIQKKQSSENSCCSVRNTCVKQTPKVSKKKLKAMKISNNCKKFQNFTVSVTPNTSVRTVSTCTSQATNQNILSSTRDESDVKACHYMNDELSLNTVRTSLNVSESPENVIQDYVKASDSSSFNRKKITFDLSPNNVSEDPKASNRMNKVSTFSLSCDLTKSNTPRVQFKPSAVMNELSDSSLCSGKVVNLKAVKRNVKPELSNNANKVANCSSNSKIITLQRTTKIQLKPQNAVNKTLVSVSSNNKLANLITCPQTIKTQPQSSDFTHSVLESSLSNDKTVDFDISQRNLELHCKPSNPVIKRNFSLISEVPRYNVPKADVVTNLNTSQVTTVVRRNVQTVHTQGNSKAITVDSSKATKSFSDAGCSNEMFNRIIQFLKIKVTLKYKSLSSGEQHQRAVNLAQNFIKNNDVNDVKLDKRTMKLLTEFAESHV